MPPADPATGEATEPSCPPPGSPRAPPSAGRPRSTRPTRLLPATGTGTDDQTLTRAALVGSVALLRSAVEGVEAAGAGTRRRRGRRSPRAAGTATTPSSCGRPGRARLDSLVLDTGGDHVHLFLAPDGDPDSVPMEFRDHPDE